MRKILLILAFGGSIQLSLKAQPAFGTEPFISFEKSEFAISEAGKSAPLIVSQKDWPGVIRAFKDLQADIEKVTSYSPSFYTDKVPRAKVLIIAGTIGRSDLISKLVENKKLNVSDISGKWESFLVQIVSHPFPGVQKALVISGSDKRGTIYGIYEVSRQIGVSPWYWWADVSVDHKEALYAMPGRFIQGPPSVKYRGIFLNDEAPDLTNWIRAKYGTVAPGENPPMPPGVANYGHEFYTRLFELLLRLKG